MGCRAGREKKGDKTLEVAVMRFVLDPRTANQTQNEYKNVKR